jgi:hypothetical protein
LREERRLRVFKNRVLRRIFEPKMDEVTGESRKLHNEELNDMYSSQNIVPGDQFEKGMSGAFNTYGGEERFCCGNLRGKRPHERPGRRWEDNIMIELQEVE